MILQQLIFYVIQLFRKHNTPFPSCQQKHQKNHILVYMSNFFVHKCLT